MIWLLLFLPSCEALWELNDYTVQDVIVAEGFEIIVIDNFFKHLDDIECLRVEVGLASNNYPGVRYKIFDEPDHPAFSDYMCGLSSFTLPPHELNRMQRIPHSDGPNDDAILVYLKDDDNDGTAFYRHRGSGSINPDFDNYRSTMKHEASLTKPEDGYLFGSNDRWEMIYHVKAKRNRALIYDPYYFHSAYINSSWNRTSVSCFKRHNYSFTFP